MPKHKMGTSKVSTPISSLGNQNHISIIPAQILQHGNKTVQVSPNSVQLNQIKAIPTYMDEFKYGFPTNGLSSTSFKWWGSENHPQNSNSNSNSNLKDGKDESHKDEHGSGVEDSETLSEPSALLCSIRRKAVEDGHNLLGFGDTVFEFCEPNKRQKSVLLQVFGSSMPHEWSS